MSRPQTPDSHRICPTCESDLSEEKTLDYLAHRGNFAPKNDGVFGLYEETARLVSYLGALAQAGPLAVAQAFDGMTDPPDWMEYLIWLAEDLTKETDRRLRLLREAGQIWKRRAEQSPERKEG
jgi:hypothetical protein